MPAVALAVALAAFLLAGGGEAVSVDALHARYADLAAWTAAHPWLARAGFVAAVTALIAIGFPSVAVPMFAGGVLFGLAWGAPLALIATAAGSTIFFLASRHARAAAADTRLGALMQRLEAGVRHDAFFYLLFLRFLPIVPTVAATLAAAAAHAPLRSFLAATFLGLIPASFIYTGIGAAAVDVLARGGEVTLAGAMLRPEVLWPLGGLIALSLAAIVFRARLAR
ncbi:membrane protein [alpha proteobacterium U9-1i]|nr:membrane protein [alpha proteobacterium U9-1i]